MNVQLINNIELEPYIAIEVSNWAGGGLFSRQRCLYVQRNNLANSLESK